MYNDIVYLYDLYICRVLRETPPSLPVEPVLLPVIDRLVGLERLARARMRH